MVNSKTLKIPIPSMGCNDCTQNFQGAFEKLLIYIL